MTEKKEGVIKRVYTPCRKLIGEHGLTCGKPAKVSEAGALCFCEKHRKRLPYWPIEDAVLPEVTDSDLPFIREGI